MTVTAEEYAAQPKTDAATAIAMRIAMANAVIAMKAKAEKYGINQFTAGDAVFAIKDAVAENDILRAAGTQELVARYYAHTIHRQENPDEAARAFLSSLTVTPEQIEQAVDGTLSNGDLLSLGGDFLKSAKIHLGIKTLTEDFRASIQNPEVTRDITIEPEAFTSEQAAFVDEKYSLFVVLDELDNAASKVGLGSPRVNHLIDRPVSMKEYEALTPLVEAATHLKSGTSISPESDFQTIVSMAVGDKLDSRMTTSNIADAFNPYAAMASQYEQERVVAMREAMFAAPKDPAALKAFGEAVLDAVVRTSTSDEALGITVRGMLEGQCRYQVSEVSGAENLNYVCPNNGAEVNRNR